MPIKKEISARPSAQEDEQHLRELAEMVRQSTDMISRHTPGDWRFIYASPAVTPLLGFGVDEIIGMSASELYHPDDVADFKKRASSVNYDRGIYTHTYRFRCKDGHYTWLESTSRSIRDPDTGKQREILVVSRDVSWRHEAEEKLQRQQSEMNHASRLISMGALASGLAHELNQPLTAITNYVQGILRRMEANPPPVLQELRQPLERIAATALRAGEIIHRMRNFARKGEVNHETLDMADIITEVVNFCGSMARKQVVELGSTIPDNLPPVRADRVQVEQVLVNLLLNAFEASEYISQSESRSVWVDAVLQPEGLLRVGIHDRGEGLPEQGSEHLFEQFSSTKPKGLGMGLPISRALIETHGGQLWAENREGGGASFYFTLPLCSDTQDKENL